QKPVSLSAYPTTVIFLILCSVCLFKAAYAIDITNNLNSPQDFKINYHEPLDYKFQGTANQSLNSNQKSSAQAANLDAEVLEFEAFGKQFKLMLQSNPGLIAKLPGKQKLNIKQFMQLYRGVIEGIDGSWVRISRMKNGISGMIWDGSEMYVIDNSNAIAEALGGKAGEHENQYSYPLIYRLSDTTTNSHCGLDSEAKPLNDYTELVEELSNNNLQSLPQASKQLDIAIVADTQFISNNPNTDAAVVARMNVVDGIYAEQTGVQLSISEIRSLQSSAGLTSTSAGSLLDQFSRFSDSSDFNNPGLAHLFTGHNLNGSTIGIAFISALCSNRFGVGISEIRGTGTAGALTVAHEIGHNFGAPHDNQSGSVCASTPQGFIMNPLLDGSDTFSACSLAQMQPNIENAACINDIDPIDPTSEADISVVVPVNPITAPVNTSFEYTVELNNSGPEIATNVSVQISIPDGITAESGLASDGDCTINTNGLNCDLNDLDPGSTTTISIQLLATQEGRFTSSVNISADNDTNSSNDTGDIEFIIDETIENSLINASFDSDSEGFTYSDDAFLNTSQPDYEQGNFQANRGFSGGGLQVLLGGIDNRRIDNMSAGWERGFQLTEATSITLSFRVKLTQSRHYESDEISEALAAIDGEFISPDNTGNLLSISGDGNGGPRITSGWQQIAITIDELAAGQHTLTLGGFNNKKTFFNERTEVLIDDVVISTANTPDAPTPTGNCPEPAQFDTNGTDLNFCWFELSSVPTGAKPYCGYLNSHQTLGYYYDINLPMECPEHSRATTNGDNLNFCLFEDIPLPQGAVAQCEGLENDRRIGYSFPAS
nr:DUF11 domain-containing protein [Gammaproteobacteria bacterium]